MSSSSPKTVVPDELHGELVSDRASERPRVVLRNR